MTQLQEVLVNLILSTGTQYEYDEKVDTLLDQFFTSASSFSDVYTEFSKISAGAQKFGFKVVINPTLIFIHNKSTKFAIKVSSSQEVIKTYINYAKEDGDEIRFKKLQALPSNASNSSVKGVIGESAFDEYLDWNFYSDNFGGDTTSVNYAANKDFIYGYGAYAY
jgi:hypothetical protein